VCVVVHFEKQYLKFRKKEKEKKQYLKKFSLNVLFFTLCLEIFSSHVLFFIWIKSENDHSL
jgi:hypothetical protein